jgi:polyferredoxin
VLFVPSDGAFPLSDCAKLLFLHILISMLLTNVFGPVFCAVSQPRGRSREVWQWPVGGDLAGSRLQTNCESLFPPQRCMCVLRLSKVCSCFSLFLIEGSSLYFFAEALAAAFILICTMSLITYNCAYYRTDTFLSILIVRRAHEREFEGQVPQHVKG